MALTFNDDVVIVVSPQTGQHFVVSFSKTSVHRETAKAEQLPIDRVREYLGQIVDIAMHKDAPYAYRTVKGLAKELDLPAAIVKHCLEQSDKVRVSPLQNKQGETLYCRADRPLDFKERLERFRIALGRN
ncbi:MAG TPA: hypothetical protein VIF43_00445 [Patescibacteria group bacterium]|jgi:hypothetical protein